MIKLDTTPKFPHYHFIGTEEEAIAWAGERKLYWYKNAIGIVYVVEA